MLHLVILSSFVLRPDRLHRPERQVVDLRRAAVGADGDACVAGRDRDDPCNRHASVIGKDFKQRAIEKDVQIDHAVIGGWQRYACAGHLDRLTVEADVSAVRCRRSPLDRDSLRRSKYELQLEFNCVAAQIRLHGHTVGKGAIGRVKISPA